ncbi:hypothetical protein DCC27_002645 [Auritidibacter sp. NML130574]|nr:hypothetical protein DCC27_002645 [Auritidibacter sp. NML130574]
MPLLVAHDKPYRVPRCIALQPRDIRAELGHDSARARALGEGLSCFSGNIEYVQFEVVTVDCLLDCGGKGVLCAHHEAGYSLHAHVRQHNLTYGALVSDPQE